MQNWTPYLASVGPAAGWGLSTLSRWLRDRKIEREKKGAAAAATEQAWKDSQTARLDRLTELLRDQQSKIAGVESIIALVKPELEWRGEPKP